MTPPQASEAAVGRSLTTTSPSEAIPVTHASEPAYLNDWAEGGFTQMVADFSDVYMTRAEYEAETHPHANEPYWRKKKAQLAAALADPKWQGLEILLASYSAANYSGDAFVLFRRDGKLYEVNGGHCSCHGLEGQWEPEETTLESLQHRLDKGQLGCSYSENEYADALRPILAQLSKDTPA